MEQDNKMENLIIEVENNPLLYNLADKSYKDTRKKLDVWEEIAQKVGIESGEIASKKFHNIKDAYVAYLSKLKVRSGQGLQGKIRKYKWADQLQFLNAFVTTRSTGNLPSTADDKSSTLLLNTILEGVVNTEDDDNENDEAGASTANIELGGMSSQIKRKKVKNDEVNSAIIDYLASKSVSSNEKDGLSCFFESTLKTVRAFPKIKQIEIKKIISNAVINIEEELALSEE
ncbi:uncharacterized protein LOC117103647 isoform X2 [Anneissia japonica]|uniref:uncharacterized protein LOC117103647 isoform X2 n=1 Tax=Anneissia japonica TaxID=1529436 RepID=UPI0014256179|nr:uncharacterized protein LOC117103647 isoform X2 [Anneissia japonica]